MKFRICRSVHVIVAMLLIICAGKGVAAQNVPVLTAIEPPVVQRGTATIVRLHGAGLDEAISLAPAEVSGVTLEPVRIVKRFGVDESPGIELRVEVPADAAVGDREIRVVSAGGVSNPVKLHVSAYRPALETEPNDREGEAQTVNLPAVLTGAMDRPGDIDLYRFEARVGEQLVFHVFGERIGSALDSVIAVYDGSGREVAGNNDRDGRDSLARYEVSSDGMYTLEIRDLKYRGGDGYHYRIEAGAIAFVESVFPLGARRGRIVELEPVGFNLPVSKPIEVDLCDANVGRMEMPAHVADGPTWRVKFDVGLLDDVIEREGNDTTESAERVDAPVAINGRMDRAGDVDCFRFEVKEKGQYRFEVAARRLGSPMDAMVSLYTADGTLIERNDDTLGADARIVRELDAGVYVVGVRDLVRAGGRRYAYRLEIEPYTGERQDFSVRFLPDTPRVHRGGHVKMWCEVARAGGYPGEVTLELIDLPEGVTCEPVTIMPGASGVFTLAASADASLGTTPFRIRARGVVDGKEVERIAAAEWNGQTVSDAYVTVLEALPFKVAALDVSEPGMLDHYGDEMAELRRVLSTQTKELTQAQQDWEASLKVNPPWVAIEPLAFSAESEAKLEGLSDGSIRASGPTPVKEVYRVVARTDVTGIRAVKIEMIADETLPGEGPGRARNGNFVLSRFVLREGDGARELSPVGLHHPVASFEQQGYPVVAVLDDRPERGWAINPRTGEDQYAIFQTDRALGDSTAGQTVLEATLDQGYGDNHVIGRFRLAVTAAENPQPGMTLPADIAAIAMKAADDRTAAEAKRLAKWYRTIAPALESERARLAMLEKVIGPALEIRELEAQLAARTPELASKMEAWAERLAAGLADGGAALEMSPWHVVGPFKEINTNRAFNLVYGPERGVDLDATYTEDQLSWRARHDWVDGQIHNVFSEPNAAHFLYRTIDTGYERPVEFSFGSDDAIKVWVNGKRVVNNNARRAAAPDQERVRVTLQAGRNTVLMKVVNDVDRSGFYFKAVDTLPPAEVLAIVKRPTHERSVTEQAQLDAYYRTIAPSLERVREAIRAVRERAAVFPPQARRARSALVPLQIERADGFEGEVTVTLEGFTPGRMGGQPAGFGASHDISPVTIAGDEGIAMLEFRPKDSAPQGTRMAVLRVDAMVDGQAVTTYSRAFALTVE